MREVLEIDKKNMYSIKAAATATGYSRDYITKLARDGKIVATQVGKQWYLDLESLVQYANIADLEQKVRNKHLSEERHRERLVKEKIEENDIHRDKMRTSFEQKLKLTIPALVLGFILLGTSLTNILNAEVTAFKNQIATVVQKDGSMQKTAFSLDIKSSSSEEPAVFETLQFVDSDEAVVLLPQFSNNASSTEVQELFSDEVSVRRDERGVTFVHLVNSDGEIIGEGVPFVKVPVNKPIQ